MGKPGPAKRTNKCKLCYMIYVSKGNLKKHLITVHNIDQNDIELINTLSIYEYPKKRVVIIKKSNDNNISDDDNCIKTIENVINTSNNYQKKIKPLLDNELEHHDNNDITSINEAIEEIKDNISDIQSINDDFEKWKDVQDDHNAKIQHQMEQMYDKFESDIYHNSTNLERLDNQANQDSASLTRQINELSKEINMIKEKLQKIK